MLPWPPPGLLRPRPDLHPGHLHQPGLRPRPLPQGWARNRVLYLPYKVVLHCYIHICVLSYFEHFLFSAKSRYMTNKYGSLTISHLFGKRFDLAVNTKKTIWPFSGELCRDGHCVPIGPGAETCGLHGTITCPSNTLCRRGQCVPRRIGPEVQVGNILHPLNYWIRKFCYSCFLNYIIYVKCLVKCEYWKIWSPYVNWTKCMFKL